MFNSRLMCLDVFERNCCTHGNCTLEIASSGTWCQGTSKKIGTLATPIQVEFTHELIEEYKDTFILFDKTGDMKVNYGQAGDIMRAIGFNPTNKAINYVVGKLSEEELKNKMMDFTIFLAMIQHIVKTKDIQGTVEEFMEGLRVFDKENNGTVLGAELRHVLISLGEKMPEKDVELLLQGLEDDEGFIKYEEFIKKIME